MDRHSPDTSHPQRPRKQSSEKRETRRLCQCRAIRVGQDERAKTWQTPVRGDGAASYGTSGPRLWQLQFLGVMNRRLVAVSRAMGGQKRAMVQ